MNGKVLGKGIVMLATLTFNLAFISAENVVIVFVFLMLVLRSS